MARGHTSWAKALEDQTASRIEHGTQSIRVIVNHDNIWSDDCNCGGEREQTGSRRPISAQLNNGLITVPSSVTLGLGTRAQTHQGQRYSERRARDHASEL